MKTYTHLFRQIIDIENLYSAFIKASKNKRMKSDVDLFRFNLEKELWSIHDALLNKTYIPGPYHHFNIHEPKERLISAAPFRDRVVHHAFCNIVESIFDSRFIYDSYACRKGKGQHKAVNRYTKFCRKFKYVLKCDIEKYFQNVDIGILISIIKRRIKDQDTLWLLEIILGDGISHLETAYPIRYFPGDDLLTPLERGRGLPIGNLTSQFMANVYLNELDYFIKFKLHCRNYIRYMDDFVLFSNNKNALHGLKAEISFFLEKLRLKLHPRKNQILPVSNGVDFLGYYVFPTHRRLRKASIKRFRKRMHVFQEKYRMNQIQWSTINQSVQSWIGHAKHADTYRLRKKIFKQYAF